MMYFTNPKHTDDPKMLYASPFMIMRLLTKKAIISIVILTLILSSGVLVLTSPSINGPENHIDVVQLIRNAFHSTNKVLATGIIGTVVSVIFTPILHEWFKKRQVYLKSYTEWCVAFAGILHEFEEICGYIRKDRPENTRIPMEYKSMDMVYHLWYMHKSIDEGYRWLIMMKKDDLCAGESLDKIMDGVDRLWHTLDDKYYAHLLRNDTTQYDFKKILLDIRIHHTVWMDKMKELIEKEIKNNHYSFDYHQFRNVECYLYKKTPEGLLQVWVPRCSELFPPPPVQNEYIKVTAGNNTSKSFIISQSDFALVDSLDKQKNHHTISESSRVSVVADSTFSDIETWLSSNQS